MMTVKELEEIGYNTVVYPISALYAAAWAVKQLMNELVAKGTTAGFMDRMIHFHDFNELMDLNNLRKKESSFYEVK
jgi:methylisocitrate lyase